LSSNQPGARAAGWYEAHTANSYFT
jgi:hypothetical protein